MGGRGDGSPIAKLSGKQRKTLEKMFRKQTPNDMRLNEVKSVLRHMGYELKYKGGSAMIIEKNCRTTVVHMPHHPNKPNQMKPEAIEKIRDFIRERGDAP